MLMENSEPDYFIKSTYRREQDRIFEALLELALKVAEIDVLCRWSETADYKKSDRMNAELKISQVITHLEILRQRVALFTEEK